MALSLLNPSNITEYFPTLSDATGNLTFLNSSIDLPSQLSNPGFTNSLGCRLDEQDTSCLPICGNVTNIFTNWPNFYTCSWYPAISYSIDNYNLTTAEINLLEAKGILGEQEDLISNASFSIGNCLADYCESDQTCQSLDVNHECSLENLYPSGSSRALNRIGAISCLRDNICGSTADVNPDIGGLGVIISLLIQYLLSLFGIFIQGAINLYYFLIKKLYQPSSQTQKTAKILEKAKKNRDHHLSTLCSALVEFHKSQCFFGSTLQIAALIVLPSYLDQVQGKNQILLRLSAANAFAPITLTLLQIELLSGRSSGYLLSLSFISFTLGSTLYWQAWPQFLGPDILTFLGYTNQPTPIMSCGNMTPFAPCFAENQFYFRGQWKGLKGVYYDLPEEIGMLVWIVSFLTLLYRVLLKLWNTSHNGERFAKQLRSWRRVAFKKWHDFSSFIESFEIGGKIRGFARTISSTLKLTRVRKNIWTTFTNATLWDKAQLILGSIALFLQLISVIQVVRFSADIISTEMGFGQIVAIGIWVPVLLEYAYLEIKGAEKGLEYRLKVPLVVSAQPPVASGALGSTGMSTGVSIP